MCKQRLPGGCRFLPCSKPSGRVPVRGNGRMMNFRKFLKLCKAKDPYALQTRSVMLTCFLALVSFCSIEIGGWFMGLVEPSYTAVFWMLFGFAIICFSLGIFIAWYEYKQCNGLQPLIPEYQYRKIMEILNEDKENK